jgi:alpha-D-ribose 1-methylphosphonate 5-phosphate C-P lyase
MTERLNAAPERYYNYAYLDEQTKRMIRRAILKALAIPGYQVPFGSREMPVPYGWGTGGIQLTAAIIGPQDVYKCIDQGADDTTNAVSIRRFFAKVADVATTEETAEATIIQSRHRVPEKPLVAGQVLVFQVPQPEPLRGLEPRETETRAMHAYEEYGLQYVSLYENVSRYGRIAATAGYPVMVDERYLMSPSPIPKFDNPKLGENEGILLFGAGREKRIYAIPPHTSVRSLDFEDYPFEVQTWEESCALCASEDSYLDEVILDDAGGKMFVCSDSHHCAARRDQGHAGPMAGHQLDQTKEPAQ